MYTFQVLPKLGAGWPPEIGELPPEVVELQLLPEGGELQPVDGKLQPVDGALQEGGEKPDLVEGKMSLLLSEIFALLQ